MNFMWKCSNPDCGKEFKRSMPSQKYCCRECLGHAKWLRQKPQESHPRIKHLVREEECLVCGRVFPIYRGDHEKKFCSRDCYHAWQQDNVAKSCAAEPVLHDPWKRGMLPLSVTENSLAG